MTRDRSAMRVAAARSAALQRWLLAMLVLFALAAGVGLRDPSPPDEPRFVLAARGMVETGNWALPHRGSELYADKPATFMWLQALAYRAVGDWRVAFLLPSLLAALATLALGWDLARRLWRRRIAHYAPLALFACLQFGLQAKRAQIDMVLVALTTLSLWGLLRHLLRGPDARAWLIGCFAAGLGTVTKGVGFLPLLVLLPWTLWRWRARAGGVPAALPAAPSPSMRAGAIGRLGSGRLGSGRLGSGRLGPGWLGSGWLGVAAFVAGTAVWLAPMLAAVTLRDDAEGQAYLREILLRQTATRYADAWHHVQPPWYYLQTIATLWLPGALLLPWLLPAWWRRLRRGDARYWLLLGWAALVLLFFSLSPGKREVYIFPALPALCVAAAPLLPGLLRRPGVRAVLYGYALTFAAAAAVLGALAWSGHLDWAARVAERRAIDAVDLQRFVLWLGASGIVAAAVVLAGGRRHAARSVVLVTALLWSVYGLGLAPALDASSSARTLMRTVGARIGPEAELGLVAWREQHLLQADRAAVDFGFKQPWHAQWRDAGAWLAAAPQRRWVFVRSDALSPCVRRTEAIAIGRSNRRDWLLVPGTAWPTGCVTPPFAADDAAAADAEND